MTDFFNKLFNLRTHEWPRLSFLYAMLFVVVLGLTWGATILEAAFLERLGVEALPWFFMAKALLAIPAAVIYAAFADRVANVRLLIVILAVSLLGIGAGLALIGGGLPKLGYPLLYLLVFVPLDDIFFAHWYTYVNDFYDTRAAKRIVPVLVTAVGIGGIVGGLTMPLLNSILTPLQIIYIWMGTLVLVALLALIQPYIFGKGRATEEQPQYTATVDAGKQRQSQLDSIREGFRYVFQSPFLRSLALSALLLILLLTFLEYRTGQILLGELKTTEQIANFTGQLSGITYLIMLPIQLFLLSRLIGRVGLGNANLLYPAGNLVICGSLIFFPGLFTAALAYFGRTNFYGIIGYTTESLLYNAVPIRIKGRARAFIGGFVLPAGALIGSLLLLTPLVDIPWFLGASIGIFAVAVLGNALLVRRQYAQALIKMLEQEDFSFLLSQEVSELSVADPAALRVLQKKLEESTGYEFTVFMAQLISQIGGKEAVSILNRTARETADPRVRAGILGVLSAADLRDESVRQLFTDFLADPDGEVRQAAIAGLEQLASLRDEQFVSRLLDMVHDPDVDVCVQVLSVLARSGDFYQMASAVEVLDQLLTSEDPLHRVLGVRVLGRIGDERAARALLEHLFDSTDQVRLAAAVAIETFPLDGMPEELVASIVEGMSGLLHDPVERIRQAAVVRLGRDGSRKLYTALVGALADSSDQVRTKAVDVLTRVGKAIVPVVHTGLQSKDRQLRTMATVVLSRVSPEEFGSLIVGTNITGNLLAIYHNYGLIVALERCDAYRGIGVLQSALYEQNQQLLDEIFYLLTAVRDPAAVKIVSESLRSETARIRANATEALESLTTPQVARLTAPLFEPDLPLSELLSLSEEVWEMQHPDTVEAIQQILNDPDDSEFRMIAAYVLGEMGAALIPPGEMPTATAPEPVKDKDAGRLGLLAELTGKLEAQGGAAELKPTGRPRRSPPADLFGALIDTPVEESRQEALEPQPARETPFTLQEIEEMVDVALQDADRDVRLAAQAAKRLMAGRRITDIAKEEEILLSTIERIIFLKEVPFFQGMTVDQLRVLASVCEEELFEEDTRIFNEGDSGGVLYVVVNGRVGIEQEKRSGSFARLATIEAHSYFGEVNLFDNSPRTTSAVAIRDTLTLRLRREPLIALARQYPDLSLELINVLSERLREADDRVAELTRTRPRELHKLFDQYE